MNLKWIKVFPVLHFRKLFVKNDSFNILSKTYCNSSRIEFISFLLGITKYQAVKLLSRNRHLKHLEKNRLEETSNVLKKLKFDNKHVVENPKIFNVHPSIIQQRYQCLQEFGFMIISIFHILRYSTIVSSSPTELYSQHVLTENTKPLTSLLSHATGPPDIAARIEYRYGEYLKSSSLEKMRCAVILEYLSWAMNVTVTELCGLLESCPALCGHSLHGLNKNWDIMTQKYSFNVDNIKNNIYVLNVQPDNALQILEQFLNLGSVGIRHFALECPKLLTLQCKRLVAVTDKLQKFGISDEQLSRCPEIFLLDPLQLENRLSEMKAVPGFEIVQNHPQFLQLVCTPSTFKGWGACTQDVGVGGITILKWCSKSNEILKYHTVRRFKVRCGHRHDLEVYLADRLSRTEKEIRAKIGSDSRWLTVPMTMISKSLAFLETKGFSSDQIFQELSVLLSKPDDLGKKLEEKASTLDQKHFIQCLSHPFALATLMDVVTGKKNPI